MPRLMRCSICRSDRRFSSDEDSARVTLRNMTLKGDCYNTKGTKPQNLHLVLENTTLTGAVSTGRHVHRDFSWGLAEDPAGNPVCTDKEGRPYLTETAEDMLFGKMPVTYRFPVRDAQGEAVYAPDSEPLPMIGYAIALDRPELLGDVEVIPQAPVSGGVTVELRAGSRWNVTAPGWITALTIEAGSLLHGRLLVDGAAAEPLAGTYRGILQVLPPED